MNVLCAWSMCDGPHEATYEVLDKLRGRAVAIPTCIRCARAIEGMIRRSSISPRVMLVSRL